MKNKKNILSLTAIALVIAALLDLKYKGLGYQLLPKTIKRKCRY